MEAEHAAQALLSSYYTETGCFSPAGVGGEDQPRDTQQTQEGLVRDTGLISGLQCLIVPQSLCLYCRLLSSEV